MGTRRGLALLMGLAFVVVGLSVVAAGEESDLTLTGLFDMTITTTSLAPVSLTSLTTNVVLAWGQATALLDARLSNATFDALSVSASAPLGNINLTSSARFNPSTVEFLSWQSGASFTLLDMAISNVTNVVNPQTDSYTQWSMSGGFDDIIFQANVKLGICPLEFWEASFCGNSVWLDCDANISLCVQFDCFSGFRDITATLTELVLFEDFLGIRGSFDAALTFSVDEKVLSPTLRLEPSWFFCSDIELLGEIEVVSPLTATNLGIYGLRGQCAIGECLTFTFADSLDDAKNSAVTGKAEYFERFGISGCLVSCCGSDGSFEINAYFERPPAPSGTLFGLGLLTVSFEFQLFENFAFAFDGEFPMAGSNWELAWTFRVLW